MSATMPDPPAPTAPNAEEKRRALRELLSSRAPSFDTRLSSAQLRLWELDCVDAASGVHSFAIAVDLNGPIDPLHLRESILAAAARHAGLQSVIDPAPVPRFIHRPDIAPDVAIIEATPDSIESLVCAAAARPFRLTEELGWRATIFLPAPGSCTILFQFHHIFADRWSVAALLRDIAAAYAGALPERPPAGSPWTLAARQETWLNSTDYGKQRDAWRHAFAPPPHATEIPLAHGRGELSGYSGRRLEQLVEPSAAELARKLAASENSTLFPVLLTTFALTIRAHTGQNDLLICTPVTGRHRAGARETIGYINNVLPLRVDLTSASTFRDALACVAVSTRHAYANQDIPFHQIAGVPELAGVRATACLFAVQNIPGLALGLPGVSASYRDIPNGTSNFDLALFLEDKKEGLSVIADYKTAVLDDPAAQTIMNRFLEMLQAVAVRPDALLSELPSYRSDAPAELPGVETHATQQPSPLEPRMLAIWREVLGLPGLTPETDFFHAGGDSVRAARLFARIQRDLHLELPLSAVLTAPTVRELAWLACRSEQGSHWMSLLPLREAGERPPLFFVHGGGGNVISFKLIADGLDRDQPMYCLQAKGLKRGERPLESVEEMAAHYIDAVRAVRPNGPYALAGHSLGAAVAYEMAQRLIAEGHDVSFLGLLDHPGPNIALGRMDWIRYHWLNFSRLGGPERLEYVYHGARVRLNRLKPKGSSPALARKRSTAEMLETGMRALQSYRVRPYPGRITLFRARMGSPKILADPLGGWGDVAAKGIEIHEVPGTHLSMMDQPHVEALAAAISNSLKRP